ncbi:mitochondrial genome maintenance MGM101-domain-containing protein [Rhodotorula diobovata]|uniref:Mitochondrial genome maintenance protein MGM101 n=1 Tax=Rhodotorula diobovata TaxID=5288 RepID=A0A5C5FZD4_9BASI|nr:mitochondrial genome maintenance MGM101-domain-containing protein [Rhodotorula diobovata]
MMHRAAARTLLQRTPTHARTQATTAVKRPTSYSTPRTRTPAASPPAPSTPAAAAAAPAPRRVLTKRVTPAPAAVPAAAAEQAPPVDASVDEAPAPTPAPSSSSSIRAQPATSFAPVDALPAGGPIASSQTLAAAAATGGDPFGGAAAAPVVGPEVDWSTSYHGLSAVPFTREQGEVLMRPLEEHEIEIKPDGLLYLPEILYRRILNKAFGPGGWGMVPRGEMTVLKNLVTREWGLVAGGRLVSVARGEQTFFDPSGVPTASEGCKSNALMRCCKDLGIASELWDPVFIRAFKKAHCVEAWTEHVVSKKKQKRWRKKKLAFEYPYAEAAR